MTQMMVVTIGRAMNIPTIVLTTQARSLQKAIEVKKPATTSTMDKTTISIIVVMMLGFLGIGGIPLGFCWFIYTLIFRYCFIDDCCGNEWGNDK